MQITSPAFVNNGRIPEGYTCDGLNVNPTLEISDVPINARSLALIMHDPDASGGDWSHWVVWKISPKTKIIKENSLPNGAVQGMNDFRNNEYGGPCSSSGIHHYHFQIYALDVLTDLDIRAEKTDLEAAMREHIIDQAVLIGTYSRV